MLENRGAQQHAVVDKYVNPTAAYSMSTRDYRVRASAASAAYAITLPLVSEAKGRFYSIVARDATYAITVQDNDESEGWIDRVLTVDSQELLLYSDGLKWHDVTSGGTITVKKAITAAQVKLIRSTPIELVAAPGSGYINEFISAVLILNYGSEVFTESADNLAVKYTDGSGVAVSDTIECTGFIDQSADTVTRAVPVADAIVTVAASANQALVLHNTGDGEFAGNASDDSVLNVFTTVRIINNN